MNEQEKLIRAEQYIRQLANGVDPIAQCELPEDTALNNVRLSRCFFYVADVLRQVIDNGGKVGRPVYIPKEKLQTFALASEQQALIELDDELLFISKFTDKLNALIDESAMKKLNPRIFGAWLLEKGFLQDEIRGGNKHRVPSSAGLQLGISSEFRQTERGTYTALLYNREAQQFLLDHLDEILMDA